MIKGITVTLHTRTQTGIDPFGRPVYTDGTVSVDNVLVAPASTDDITNAMNLTGRKAIYTIAIPKGDTHVWEDQLVEFFGEIWHVFGLSQEGIEAMIPLSWNAKYQVERYE